MAKFRIEKMEDEVRKVRFVLEKQGIHTVRSQVGIVMDASGSMEDLYSQGAVQAAVERVLPVALACDVDSQADVWGFSGGNSGFAATAAVTAKNFRGYVEREMLGGQLSGIYGGGTSYAPVIRGNLEHYGFLQKVDGGWFRRGREVLKEEGHDNLPVIIYFVTDGENDDHAAALDLIETIEEKEAQIYYHLIGVGDQNFRFLKEAAKKFDNVGFLSVRDLDAFADSDEAYEMLLPRELCLWLKHEHEEGEYRGKGGAEGHH